MNTDPRVQVVKDALGRVKSVDQAVELEVAEAAVEALVAAGYLPTWTPPTSDDAP